MRRGSLVSAVAYLWIRSARNWLWLQGKRLKSPRYLVAASAAGLYLYLIVLVRLTPLDGRSLPSFEALRPFIEAALTYMGLWVVLLPWVFGGNQSLMILSEAEMQYLFSGPLTRRSVLRIRVFRALLRSALAALITTVLFRRAAFGSGVRFGIGMWFWFSTLSLYSAGVWLTRESLAQHGWRGLRVSAPALLVLGGAGTAVALWIGHGGIPPPPVGASLVEFGAWLSAVLDSGPLPRLLWPLRAPARMAMAQGWGELFAVLPGALAVLGVMFSWVVSSSVAFEEAAIAASASYARLMEAARGRGPILLLKNVHGTWVPLPGRGPRWIALTWKNLVGAARTTTRGAVIFIVGVMVLLAVGAVGAAALSHGRVRAAAMLASVCAAFAGFAALLGPLMVRFDLRKTLMMDVLRTLPLPGRSIVLGEVLASALVLTVLQWTLWLAALSLVWLGHVPLPPSAWGPGLAFPILVGPALSLGGVCVQNAGPIFFPAWVRAGASARGLEASGQRLLNMFGSLLVLSLGMVPAALMGALVGFATMGLLGSWAAVPAALVAAAVLIVESLLAMQVLGVALERVDLSE